MLVTHRTTDGERTVLWRWSNHWIWDYKRSVSLLPRLPVFGGALSETHEKICKVMDMAVKMFHDG
jgi:hypothetical protein